MERMEGVREEWVQEKIRGTWKVREGGVSEGLELLGFGCGEGVGVGPGPVGGDSSE